MRARRVRRTGNLKSGGKKFLASFRPKNFKQYWLSREGLRRIGRLAGTGGLILFLIFLFFAKDLPSPGKVNARVSAQTTKFYDRTGKHVLYEVFGDKNRSIIEFSAMPEHVKQATIAVEDKNFYKHGAFSAAGLGRAFTGVIFRDSSRGGGSTITQQYVKNALLSPERTLTRKIKELILAIEIEQFYRKDDILKLYLNEIPYGQNAYGIQAAAKTYFDKDAKQLDLSESALLAAMPQAPTFYSPYGQHPDALLARQHLILDLMVEQGYIKEKEAESAKWTLEDLRDRVRATPNRLANVTAPHFVLYLQEQLEAKYGTRVVTEGGLKVVTTLDYDKQKAAEEAIAKNMRTVRALGGSNAALVSSDPKTGQILAMVGSYDFNDDKFGAFNVAVAKRQPGSSFKPLVYATLFKGNWGPGSTLYDVSTDFGGGYRPENYNDRTYGVQSARTALAGSLNIPAVKALYLAGVKNSLKTAKDLGISTLNRPAGEYGLSLVLGSGEVRLTEMVNAYESFANGGYHQEGTAVVKITDQRGRTIQEYRKPLKAKRVLDEQIAYLISNMMSDNGARSFIFGNALTISGRTAAVKTGTTENYRDAWTMGYTPSLVTGVWAGNNDNRSMTRAASAVSAPIWRDYMATVLRGEPNEQFERPKGIKSITLDANTGKLATDNSRNKRTDIFPTWYKPAGIAESRSAVIDKLSGKLATECTPPAAKETVYSAEMHAEIPPSDPAYSRWEGPVQGLARSLGYAGGGTLPTENDDRHSCSDTKPNVQLDVNKVAGTKSRYRIKAVVTSGTFTANKLEIFLDDQVISTQEISGSTTYEFEHTVQSTGSHMFKAKVIDSGYYEAEDSDSVNVTEVGGEADDGPGLFESNSGAILPNRGRNRNND